MGIWPAEQSPNLRAGPGQLRPESFAPPWTQVSGAGAAHVAGPGPRAPAFSCQAPSGAGRRAPAWEVRSKFTQNVSPSRAPACGLLGKHSGVWRIRGEAFWPLSGPSPARSQNKLSAVLSLPSAVSGPPRVLQWEVAARPALDHEPHWGGCSVPCWNVGLHGKTEPRAHTEEIPGCVPDRRALEGSAGYFGHSPTRSPLSLPSHPGANQREA